MLRLTSSINDTVSIEILQGVGEKAGFASNFSIILCPWDRAIYNNTTREAGAIEVSVGRGT